MKSSRRIKRWFGMKEGRERKKQSKRMRLSETFIKDEEFSMDLKKCGDCNFKNSCETFSDGKGCRDVNEFTIKGSVRYLAKRKTYEMKLCQCGAKSRIEIWGPLVYEEDQNHDNFVCNVPYGVLRNLYPWRYIEGKGLVMELDEQGFREFVEVICFLGDGESYEVRRTEGGAHEDGNACAGAPRFP